MLEGDVRREISTPDRRRTEHVGVEIQLQSVAGNRIRDGRESAPRTVNDPTVRVAETRLRTGRSQPRRTPEVDQRQEHAQNDDARWKSHFSRFQEATVHAGVSPFTYSRCRRLVALRFSSRFHDEQGVGRPKPQTVNE